MDRSRPSQSSRRPLRRAAAAVASMALVLTLAPTASAADNNGRKWIVNSEFGYLYYIKYFPHSGFSSAFKSRIYEGAIQWNIGRELQFNPSSVDDNSVDIDVYWTEIPWPFEQFCAATQASGSGGQLYVATIRFDPTPCNNSSTWYSGTGTPPTGTVDAMTAAIHEFGHAVELYHSASPYADHPEACMWPYFPNPPLTKRYLRQWDKDGEIKMYPAH